MPEAMTEQVERVINDMSPGIWMDSLIAKILGCPPSPHNMAIPYSTSIEYAWLVVEWCMNYANGDLFIEYWQDGEWYICNTNLFSRKNTLAISARSNKVDTDKNVSPSFPLAICRYALKCGYGLGVISADVIINDPITKGWVKYA